jgi:hypothetical protein
MREGVFGNLMLDLRATSIYTVYSNIFAENGRPVCVYADRELPTATAKTM